jgi:hypothetical protein
MRTEKDIIKEMDSLINDSRNVAFTELRTIRSRLLFLKTCKLYLETKPNPDFIKFEIESLQYKINLLSERFDSWRAGRTGTYAQLNREYNSLNEIPKMKMQLKTLKYLYE